MNAADALGRAQPRRSTSALKTRLLGEEIDTLAAALNIFANNPAFERAAAVIARSRRRFTLGRGSEHGYAAVLTTALKEHFSQIFPVASAGIDHLDLLSDVRGGDVLIAVCLRPYRADTVEISKLYVAAGGTLVLITDCSDSPLSAFAAEEMIIPPPTGHSSDAAESTELGTTSLSVHAAIRLLTKLAAASAKGALRRTHERKRVATLLRLHERDARWNGSGAGKDSETFGR